MLRPWNGKARRACHPERSKRSPPDEQPRLMQALRFFGLQKAQPSE